MALINRYRKAGEEANRKTIEQFGDPKKSLFIATKLLSLHQETDVTDEREEVVYKVKSKFFSLHDKTDITDANGRQVSHIEKKIFTLHERRLVTMADGTKFQLSNELFHIIKDITNIEGLGWQLQGNIIGLNFELYDEKGEIVAVISQKMISIHDKYCIDLYQTQHEKIVVTIVIALQHMIRDRENNESSSDVSFSSDF